MKKYHFMNFFESEFLKGKKNKNKISTLQVIASQPNYEPQNVVAEQKLKRNLHKFPWVFPESYEPCINQNLLQKQQTSLKETNYLKNHQLLQDLPMQNTKSYKNFIYQNK